MNQPYSRDRVREITKKMIAEGADNLHDPEEQATALMNLPKEDLRQLLIALLTDDIGNDPGIENEWEQAQEKAYREP